jgi:hypothetical protein
MSPCRGYSGWTLALLLLVAAPTTSFAAQGLNLAWSNCLGEGTGFPNRNFACGSNNGVNVMVGSFELASDLPQVIGTEIILQLASASPSLPDWWRFKNAGTCRQSSMAMNTVLNPVDVVCVDWSQGFAIGGLGAYCTSTFPCVGAPSAANVAIVKLIDAVPQENAQDLAGGTEYFDFNLLINNVKTVGTGACTGCQVPVCIVLNSINVVDRGNLHPRFISGPTFPGSDFVTWQGGGVPSTPQGTGCPAATATRKSTWGSVKSLYR